MLDNIEKMNALESATTGALLNYEYAEIQPRILMSRDFFDFSIEHLSSTTNQISEDPNLVRHLVERMTQKVAHLKKVALRISTTLRYQKPFGNNTIVVIPFSTKSASMGNDFDRITLLRRLFFEATFWSVYRSFPHIAVSVSRQADFDNLIELKLPIFELFRSPSPII